MELETGTRIGRYRVETLLGRGGQGSVWKVTDHRDDSVNALKIIEEPSPEVRQRLALEGHIQATLDHPHIVKAVDVVEWGGCAGLVMEYVDGPSLQAVLKLHRLTEPQALAVSVAVLEGVQAAHLKGLIHRDLKPANILLARHESGLVPKIADFGIAKALKGEARAGKGMTRTGTAMGTPQYMAPEQFSDAKTVDLRADVYSLAAVIYELFTGVKLYNEPSIYRLMLLKGDNDYPRPREVEPRMSEALEAVLVRALESDRELRYADAQALLTALRAAVPAAPDPGCLVALREALEAAPTPEPLVGLKVSDVLRDGPLADTLPRPPPQMPKGPAAPRSISASEPQAPPSRPTSRVPPAKGPAPKIPAPAKRSAPRDPPPVERDNTWIVAGVGVVAGIIIGVGIVAALASLVLATP